MAGLLRKLVSAPNFITPQLRASRIVLDRLQHGGKRAMVPFNHLYTDNFLGIDMFLENRKRIEDQFGHMRGKQRANCCLIS